MTVLGQMRLKKRIPLEQAQPIAEHVESELQPMTDFVRIVGSVRRKAQKVGDIEFVVLPKDLGKFLETLKLYGFKGGDRKQTGRISGVKTEIHIAHEPKELGAMVLAHTGDYALNVTMRSIAKKQGMLLSDTGLWKDGEPVLQGDDEREFFEALSVRWHEPEERSLAARKKPKKKAKAKKAKVAGANPAGELDGFQWGRVQW